jgi:hypothetical protein
MKNTPHPDRSSEAAKVRDELSDHPDVLRSLDALAREDSDEVEIPPIPDDLRDQWQDRYGAARQPVPAEKKSWLSRFSGFWMYGGATALAALAIFFVLQHESPVTPSPDDDTVLMRGGGDYESSETKLIVFIPSNTISLESFASTRKENSVLEAKDMDDATRLLTEKNIKDAVILDARGGGLFEWIGKPTKGLQLLETSSDFDEYDLSEALDEYLKQ